MQTEAQLLGAEVERVVPKVPMLFERDNLFYATLEKRKGEVVSARDMRQPLELSPGGAFRQFDTENGDMGTGDGPAYDKALVNTVPLLQAIQWSTKAQWSTDDKRKAVVNTFRTLLAKSMSEFRRNVESLCSRGEGNGILATISNVATAGGVDTYTLGTDGFGAKLIRKGNYVNVYSADLLTNRTAGGSVKVTYVDYVNKKIQVAAVAGAIATDLIVVDGVTGTPPVSIKGVQYNHNNASTGNWFGFDRSTTPEIIANGVNAGAALTLPLPRLAINKIGDRIGIENRNGKRLTAWMHPCQISQYEALGQGANVMRIQKEAKDEALDLYFSDNMRMAGAPVKPSFCWDKTRIDFIDLDVWGRAEMKTPGFYEVDGRRIFEMRGTSGGLAASMIFYLVCQFNPYVNNPAACAYIYALTVPSGY